MVRIKGTDCFIDRSVASIAQLVVVGSNPTAHHTKAWERCKNGTSSSLACELMLSVTL